MKREEVELDQLYQEVILDHHKHPRCQGCLECPDANCVLRNPLCGDHIELSMNVDEQTVSEIRFSGHGCAISQASASMMTDLCRGRSLEQAGKLAADFRAMMRGEKSGEQSDSLGDAVALENGHLGHAGDGKNGHDQAVGRLFRSGEGLSHGGPPVRSSEGPGRVGLSVRSGEGPGRGGPPIFSEISCRS